MVVTDIDNRRMVSALARAAERICSADCYSSPENVSAGRGRSGRNVGSQLLFELENAVFDLKLFFL
jgi:hypothetical protein